MFDDFDKIVLTKVEKAHLISFPIQIQPSCPERNINVFTGSVLFLNIWMNLTIEYIG